MHRRSSAMEYAHTQPPGPGPHDHEPHDHDRGLAHDLPVLLSRRRALTLFGGGGLAAALVACSTRSASTSSAATGSATSSSPTGSSATTASAGTEIPEETAGP